MINSFHLYFLLSLFFISLPLYSQSTNGRLPITVVDTRTGHELPSSSICIEQTNRCFETDSSGNLLLDTLSPGLYSLVISAEGYDTLVIPSLQIKSGLNKMLIIELEKRSVTQILDKMVVVSRKLSQKKLEQTTSVSRLNNFELSNTAGTGNDVNRVLATLPSTISGVGSDFDNNLYVRGGGSRENVYLIDGIQFENASHFSSVDQSGGAIGFLNGNLVQSLDFYAGGFPARLPSRLSSVIDLNLRTGSFNERKHQIDLNMSGIGLTTEGPLFKGKASYLASIRLVDLSFLKPLLTVGGLPRYGDIQLKTVFTPTTNQTIRLVGIGAFDHFDEDPEMYNYGDAVTVEQKYDEYHYKGGGGITWDISTDKLRNVVGMNGTIAIEERFEELPDFTEPIVLDTFKFNLTQYFNTGDIVADSIIDPDDTLFIQTRRFDRKRLEAESDRRWRIGLSDDFSYYIGEQDQINAGLFGAYEHFYISNESGEATEYYQVYLPDSVTPAIVPGSREIDMPFRIDSAMAIKHAGGYIEYILNRGLFKALIGLRGDYYTDITDYGVSPRLGMSLKIPNIGIFSMSGGLYYQFPSDFSGLLADIMAYNPNWGRTSGVPLDEVKLQRNWQGVIGYERQIGDAHILTTEAYYKWYDREYPFTGPGDRRYGEYTDNGFKWRLDKPDGKKRAYGIEFSFQKKKYDFIYYSVNYSLFQVENRYTDDKWYLDEYSIRNAAGIVVGSNFLKHHGISLRMQISEGKPYTSAVYDPATDGWSMDTTKAYYSERLDPMFSLNLRYSFKIFRKWGNLTGYLEVWNVLNNQPVVERYISRDGYIDYTTNGILPVAGITVDF